MIETATVTVGDTDRPGAAYDVVIGEGVLDRLPAALGSGVRRVAVIAAGSLQPQSAAVRRVVEAAGLEVLAVEVPDGEAAKVAPVAASCWAALGQAGFTRSDVVVTVGGGATTDLGGFVAATWLRGVRVVHVPTTLLGMVDAAVGGKTGINTAEGKNLVGSFHQPAGVLCDLVALRTLPRAELVSGLAEVIKCGFIADPVVLDIVEGSREAATTPGTAELAELVRRAVEVKAAVVSADFEERGGTAGHPGREALNYGHTLAHAIERTEDYRVRHGEAVSIGMVFVAELARLDGRLDAATAGRHRDTLRSVGLPTTYTGAPWPDLLATMRIDKKSRGDLLRFVVLDGLARPAVLEGPSPQLLEAAFATVATG
ncbi:MAG: 3-dehydroquinate synthase [uncultured Nocardioidaceae bacterium]|uniref:3-dehydroquinate synthase n=1 Tax=uncultured Nocardioidaceae bacterium TaxID=253824 RepID=A0A6J4MMU9_9ACTN|nr:MAG: 3-dehydroquinate synthase [uncultured Nocardioidaceae bacterium]